MDKIIIFTGDSEADERLTTSLRVLFPECKIQVLSNLEEVPVPAEPAYGDNASATLSVSQEEGIRKNRGKRYTRVRKSSLRP